MILLPWGFMLIKTSYITYQCERCIVHSTLIAYYRRIGNFKKIWIDSLLKMTENATFISFFITTRMLKKDIKYKDQKFKTDLYFGE